jgi:hypothetical protein
MKWKPIAWAAGNRNTGLSSASANSLPSTASSPNASSTRPAAAAYSPTGSAAGGLGCQQDRSAPCPAAAAVQP